MENSRLDYLRIVGETATFLERSPNDRDARFRRDESLRWASAHYPPVLVARAARISEEELAVIVATDEKPARRLTLGRLRRKDSPDLGEAAA